jgi:hypothetical protein
MSRDRKLPALQWYAGDWRKDVGVQTLSFHDRGVWFEMLMLMHESEQRGALVLNGHAMTSEMIARAIGLDNQTFNQTLSTLLTLGVAGLDEETGAIVNRRMIRDEKVRKIHQEAGKLGGNPVLLNQNGNQTVNQNGNQKPTPSSSSSSSLKTKNIPRQGGGAQTPEEKIYATYPRKEGHRDAIRAIENAVERVRKGEGPLAAIPDKHEAQVYLFRRTQDYARSPEGSRSDRNLIPYPQKWFNSGRYLDDDVAWSTPRTHGKPAAPKSKLEFFKPGEDL